MSEDRPAGQAWLFPAAAADALSALDAREVFTVEFLFRDGSIARFAFEAGNSRRAGHFWRWGRFRTFVFSSVAVDQVGCSA